jgi:hypothetical protein
MSQFILVTVRKDSAARKNHTRHDWAKSILPGEALPLLEEWNDQDYKSFGILEQPLRPLYQN